MKKFRFVLNGKVVGYFETQFGQDPFNAAPKGAIVERQDPDGRWNYEGHKKD